MWKARGLRFPNMRESRSRGLGIFLIRHFHRFLVTAELCPSFRNLQNFRQVDSNDRCCSSESSWSRMGPTILDHVKDQSFHWHLSQSGSFMEIADHFAATEARGCSRVCEWLYIGASCSALHHSAIERLNASSARARVSLRKFRSRSRALDFERYRQPSEDDRNPSGYGDTARTRGIRQRTFERDSEADVAGALLGYLAGRVDRTFNRVHVWLE